MLDLITSPNSFIAILVLYGLGAVGSLLLNKQNRWANRWQCLFGMMGALWGLIFSIATVLTGRESLFLIDGSFFPLLSVSFQIDPLAVFFIGLISLITLACSIYGLNYITQYYNKYNIGALGFFYHSFIVGMLMVVTAANGLFFLIAWEIMALASYCLVIYDRNDTENVKAGFLYLVMTHVGTAFIVVAWLLLYKFTGSFDFNIIQIGAAHIPEFIKNCIFVLALIGLGTKAGIIPLHIWLPSAHPAAPSHVSALMSGVMIKTGIYMMIRLFFDLLQPIPLWWGITLLIIGSVSSLLGVLYALTEHDIKRLLAYHSIENIGIILLGLGSALVFAALGNIPLALLGLTACLFHTLNHATFKSLLFLSAGSVIHQTGTRNMEEYGGLIKYMPGTAMFFLIGSMAISALPPFNGFFSEWLTFQTLLQGMGLQHTLIKLVFIIATLALAITGGLALACFVKAFGATFLARPRTTIIKNANESPRSLLVAMGGLAGLCLVFGLSAGYLGSWFQTIAASLAAFQTTPFVKVLPSIQLVAMDNFGSISPLAVFASLTLGLLLIIGLVTVMVNRRQTTSRGATWDCGITLTPRMEITATGFARSIILIFSGILRPSIQHDIEYHDSEMRYLPKSTTVNFGIQDIYQYYFYQPLNKFITVLSLRTKKIQSGNINMYVMYILIAVLVALYLAQ